MVVEKRNLKKLKVKLESINGLDRALILVGLYVLIFVIVTIVIYTINKWPYDALFPYALGVGGIEGLCTCVIQVSKYKRDQNGGKKIEEDEDDRMVD